MCFSASCRTTAAFCPGVAYNPAGPAPIFTVGTVGSITPERARFHAHPPARRAEAFSQLTGIFRRPIWRTTTSTCSSRFRSKVVLQVGYVGVAGTPALPLSGPESAEPSDDHRVRHRVLLRRIRACLCGRHAFPTADPGASTPTEYSVASRASTRTIPMARYISTSCRRPHSRITTRCKPACV